MANRSHISRFLIFGTSFVGGMALGLLLAPKSGRENIKWLQNHAAEMGDRFSEYGTHRLKNIRHRLQKGIDKNVPDLYGATEHIALDESDFPHI